MAFRHFSVLKISDHTSVNEDDIDMQVCNKFGFPYSEEDYGHFFFTENEAEEFHQKSISWVGLLDWIIYYSHIGSGKRSNYEIEAALAWNRQYLGMPWSTVAFLSDLLRFIEDKGYYIYVHGHSADKGDDFFYNMYKAERIFENESGLFLCGNSGKLFGFFPATNNMLDKVVIREHYQFQDVPYKPCVHLLIIPEGVTSIDTDFFRGGLVEGRVLLPSTLTSIGTGAFSDSHLPEIVIPENVRMIDTFAFGNSIIQSVRFIKLFECEYLRQFKGAQIETIYLPQKYQQQWQKGFDGYAYLHEVKNIVYY